METLETPRLVLRPLELADARRTQKIFPHWDVVKYLNAVVPWPYPADGAESYCRDLALPAMARGEEWHWTIRLKDSTAEHIGGISLKRAGMENRGFWLGLDWHRKGIATEAAQAVTGYWFDVLGFEAMTVMKAVENTASRRISEASGMRIVGMEERGFVCGRRMAEIWTITADEWRSRAPGVTFNVTNRPF
jgi:[ribosomal protein S5]-alanine N-acetyltransferase